MNCKTNSQFVDEPCNFEERSFILILRAWAIFSVICAHVSDSSDGTVNLLLSSLGSYGVIIFFFLAGYVFYYEKRMPLGFLKRKIVTIVIPWMFCGTLDWLYTVLRKGGMTLANWLSTTFVYSHYYYLSALFLCYLFTWAIRKRRIPCYVIILLSSISLFFTGKGLIDLYPYINVMNWIGYFVIGIVVAQNNAMEALFKTAGRLLPFAIIATLFSVSWVIYDGFAVSYWAHGTIIVISVIIVSILGLTYKIGQSQFNRVKKTFELIGRFSFTIYLIHMPFAGVFKYLSDCSGIHFIQLFLPFVVLCVITIIVFIITSIPINKFCRTVINTVLGIRE